MHAGDVRIYYETWVRDLGARAYDRCYAPAGVLRQLHAISRWSPDPEALWDEFATLSMRTAARA